MCLQMRETPRLEGVGGNPVPTLGHAEVDVVIGDGVYKAAVVVSARRERPNFIIGADFLATDDCDLSLHQNLSYHWETEIQCITEGEMHPVYCTKGHGSGRCILSPL